MSDHLLFSPTDSLSPDFPRPAPDLRPRLVGSPPFRKNKNDLGECTNTERQFKQDYEKRALIFVVTANGYLYVDINTRSPRVNNSIQEMDMSIREDCV